MPTATLESIIVSPEGLDEIIKREITFRITLTQGEKYRTYIMSDGKPDQAGKSFSTMKEAEKDVGITMAMFGGLMADPKGMIEVLMGSLKKGPSDV